MEHFILQAEKKLSEGQQPYGIPGLRDIFGNEQKIKAPTEPSIKNGLLEWIVPNNAFNQAWLSEHYSHFKILQAGQEAKGQLMPGMPAPITAESVSADSGPMQDVEFKDATQVKLDGLVDLDTDEVIIEPIQDAEVIETEASKAEKIKKLKDIKTSELASLGFKAPKNSSLKKLDSLLEKAKESLSEA